ncbi:MAG: ATP-binding cassette domain-containing protein [Candidatus Margulisbacteria bacterium]|nr:ATP-binding cassette domain-containing protein [Candidatus Margulisiibacteriota bacterium]MBU1617701.1 ATP-binding cassette domain-containing protein [Candidatus Margulisiibacteriota bacterium]
MKLIEITNLTKKFNNITAVNDLSLTIRQGETLGLVGESGSGKSTLSRLILKLIEPDSGRIEYQGIKEMRRECQIVFQDPQNSLNPRIRVGEAIGEPILIHSLLPKNKIAGRVGDLLELVRLPASYAGRFPNELSGGERQRVGIARALAGEAKFLILDEPVSALDLFVQVEILKLLRDLKTRLELTYLFIAHDLSVISYLSDRVAVMKEGRIIELGQKDEVLIHPRETYTKKLLAATL